MPTAQHYLQSLREREIKTYKKKKKNKQTNKQIGRLDYLFSGLRTLGDCILCDVPNYYITPNLARTIETRCIRSSPRKKKLYSTTINGMRIINNWNTWN